MGLSAYAYTLRYEKHRLGFDMSGDPVNEYVQFFRLGLDGLFSDFPDTAVAGRTKYLKETGR